MATRRQVIGSVGTLLAGGGVLTATSSSASAKTDLELHLPPDEDDDRPGVQVVFESEEGYLRYLRVSPTYNIKYNGFTEAADNVLVRLYATVDGKTRQLSKVVNRDVSGLEGNVSGSPNHYPLPEANLVHVFGDDAFTTGYTTVKFTLQAFFSNGVEGEETAEVEVEVNQPGESEGAEKSGNSSNVDVGGSLSFDGEGA